MPTPQDLVYKMAFDAMMKQGYSQRDAETAGAEAVRYWRRGTRTRDAVERAVTQQKKAARK